ncbi:MAG: type II toxin-antitoxin system HicB family antitoxin [Dehalococcoidia bacterium]
MAREVVQRFEVIYEPDEDGLHVFVPALKGCHSWGATRDEARENIREAISLWLESARANKLPIPDRETVEVAAE